MALYLPWRIRVEICHDSYDFVSGLLKCEEFSFVVREN